MDDKQLSEIKERCEKATPGPWNWEVSTINKCIGLENWRDKVMDFARYGMDGAAPRFNVDGIMERADKLAKSIPGMEHHRGFDDYINHPDAFFIAHSRTDIPALIAEVERLKAENEALNKALYSACYAYVKSTPGMRQTYGNATDISHAESAIMMVANDMKKRFINREREQSQYDACIIQSVNE